MTAARTVFLLARRAVYRGLMPATRLLARPVAQRRFRLAILKLDRLGDGVLALGATRRLIEKFGETETLLIVSPIAEPLFRREFPRAAFLVMPAFCERLMPDLLLTLMRHARELRGISAGALVCLRHQPSDYLHLVAGLMRADAVFATRWAGPREHTSLEFPRCQFAPYPEAGDGLCRELEAHRRVVTMVLQNDPGADAMLPAVRAPDVPGEDHLLLCPAAGDAQREYPPSLLAEAARVFLAARPGVPVRVCLPPGDHRAPLELALKNAGVPVASWIFPEDTDALIAEIAAAGIVLAPESAPAHIAIALDRPGVFLLGGGHHGLLAPWARGARQRWLSHPLPCYHCRWRCTQTEPFCITRITPREIAAALAEIHTARQK